MRLVQYWLYTIPIWRQSMKQFQWRNDRFNKRRSEQLVTSWKLLNRPTSYLCCLRPWQRFFSSFAEERDYRNQVFLLTTIKKHIPIKSLPLWGLILRRRRMPRCPTDATIYFEQAPVVTWLTRQQAWRTCHTMSTVKSYRIHPCILYMDDDVKICHLTPDRVTEWLLVNVKVTRHLKMLPISRQLSEQ